MNWNEEDDLFSHNHAEWKNQTSRTFVRMSGSAVVSLKHVVDLPTEETDAEPQKEEESDLRRSKVAGLD